MRNPSYVVFFVTSRCNAACPMCLYKTNMQQNSGQQELTVDEYARISQSLGKISILGISGGEPFLREDLKDVVGTIYDHCKPWVLDLPTNGFLTAQVLSHVKEIATRCPSMNIDIQLSIDGPQALHDRIRGVPGGFMKVKETYLGLVALRKQFRNLRVKACIVFSQYNEDQVAELLKILNDDFSGLDRVILSVAHGRVEDPKAAKVSWDKYFQTCALQRKSVVLRNKFDLYSTFTMALRFVKNEFLKDVLREKDMYRHCGAGKSVVVIDELGKVFGCEQLWEPVGDLRQNGYDFGGIYSSPAMKAFQARIRANKCTCHWGLPMSNALLYSPRYYPKILAEMLRILFAKNRKSEGQ